MGFACNSFMFTIMLGNQLSKALHTPLPTPIASDGFRPESVKNCVNKVLHLANAQEPFADGSILGEPAMQPPLIVRAAIQNE